MNKAAAKALCKTAKKAIVKHGPEILNAIGVVGFVASTLFAVIGTAKAVKEMAEEPVEIDISESDNKIVKTAKTCWAYIKRFWKYYILSLILTLFSIGCIVTSNHITLSRITMLSSMYKLTETAFENYQANVAEEIGCEKEAEVWEKTTKDFMVYPTELILCKESVTGRLFYSTVNKIDAAVNRLNKEMLSEMSQSVNDYCYEIDIPNVSDGDDFGWDISKGLIEASYGLDYIDDGRPCLMVNITKVNTDFTKMR